MVRRRDEALKDQELSEDEDNMKDSGLESEKSDRKSVV